MKRNISIALLVLATLGLFTLYRVLNNNMTEYPLVDAERFFQVLPDMPKRDSGAIDDPKYFDKFGYLVGEQGARISAPHIWTKRAVKNENPYDVDLSVNVVYLPSVNQAKDGFASEIENDRKLFAHRAQDIHLNRQLHAENTSFIRLNTKTNQPTYILSARHGNYLFRFVARLNTNGYFRTEEDLFKQLEALDTNIFQVLHNERSGT